VPPIKSPESNTATTNNLKYAQAVGAAEGSPTSSAKGNNT